MTKITWDLLEKSASPHVRKRPNEEHHHFLSRITYFYLHGKGIKIIEQLHHCKSATALYLYDNKIQKIQNLDPLADKLNVLHLQNNLIERIENISMLQNLTQLYLGHNTIKVITGLEALCKLKELYLESQRLAKDEKLMFDPLTIDALGSHLKVLDISRNNLDSLADLKPLYLLEHLHAVGNRLSCLEGVAHDIYHWHLLQELDLRDNPVCRCPRYTCTIRMALENIEMHDGKPVSHNSREFFKKWKERIEKSRQGSYATLGSQAYRSGSSQSVPVPSSKYSGHMLPLYSLPALPVRSISSAYLTKMNRSKPRKTSMPQVTQPSSQANLGH